MFENVSLEIGRGEIVGLFGASGIGNSTLGDICLGLNTPLAGSVRWYGKPITRGVLNRHRSGFQKLFQNPVTAFPPNLTLSTVFDKLTPAGKIAPGLTYLLRNLDLDISLLDRRPDQTSGGELQRMAMVRVLLGQPDFIVCDEPSSRLDMSVQLESTL